VDVEPVTTADIYRRTVDEFDRRIEAVRDDQWENPTPCTDWNVRALVNHVVNEDKWVAPLLAGETIAQVGNRFDGDLLGADPHAAWKATRTTATDAVDEPGAAERTVDLSRGPTPADVYLQEVAADNLIHAWDLAMGTDGDTALDAELVEFADDFYKPLVRMWRAGGAFGAEVEVPMDADRQTKLLGMLGRRA
jgi:uncharacterized protein (TIGR03086 family)